MCEDLGPNRAASLIIRKQPERLLPSNLTGATMISVSIIHLEENKLTSLSIVLEIRPMISPSLASIAVKVSACNSSSWLVFGFETKVRLTIGFGCSGGSGNWNTASS